MSDDLEAAARSALTELLGVYRAGADRILAALAALDSAPPSPAAPVTVQLIEAAVSPPAAKVGRTIADRVASAQAAGKVMVTCADCGKEFSQLGIGPHRRHHTNAAPASAPPAVPDRVLAAAAADRRRADTQDIFTCVTCSAVFTERSKLANHTITSHRRGPTSGENTTTTDETPAA